jgi:hypothetical protein
MPRSQKNDNFIDKTFTIIADLLLQVLPTTQREKEAFAYYRDGAICPLGMVVKSNHETQAQWRCGDSTIPPTVYPS